MTVESANVFADVADVVRRFDAHDYLLDDGTAAAFYLADHTRPAAAAGR